MERDGQARLIAACPVIGLSTGVNGGPGARAVGLVAAAALGLMASACATSRPAGPEPRIAAEPANARVRLYATCVAAAVQADTLERYGRYIRYLCAGPPARALYEASATHVRSRGWERVEGGRTTRGFSTRAWDDRCWAEAGTYTCSLTQPVGAFLDPSKDVALPPRGKR